jgi:two-component system, response regulator
MNAGEIEIILIEDNPDDAVLTIRALKKYHLSNHLVHIKDGAEALEFIFGKKTVSAKPRVILLDLNLPKVSGLEILARLKSDEKTKTIPVVVLTSSNESPDVERCYELGANSYIVKPVGFENFAKVAGDLGFYWMLTNSPIR